MTESTTPYDGRMLDNIIAMRKLLNREDQERRIKYMYLVVILAGRTGREPSKGSFLFRVADK